MSRDLPMPASPPMRTVVVVPPMLRSRADPSAASSISRPMNVGLETRVATH